MKSLLKTILLFVVIAGLGYVGVLWSSDLFSKKKQDLEKLMNDNRALLQKGASIEMLERYASQQRELDRIINQWAPFFEKIKELKAQINSDPNIWKQKLSRSIEQWNKDFPYQKDFYYGFTDYHLNLPEPQQVSALEIQLALTQELLSILKKSKIDKLKAIRRTPTANNEKNDLIPQKDTSTPSSDSYHFELEFSCKPFAVRHVINQLLASEYLFCPYAIEIKNSADPQKNLSSLKKDGKLPLVSGDEGVEVKITGEFCLWDAY